jgi:hypothetical protein
MSGPAFKEMFQLQTVFCPGCGKMLQSYLGQDGTISVKYYPGCQLKTDDCKVHEKKQEEEDKWRKERKDPSSDKMLLDLEFWESRTGHMLAGLDTEEWLWSYTLKAHIHRESGETISHWEWDREENPYNVGALPENARLFMDPYYVHKPPKTYPGGMLFRRSMSKL